MASFSVGIVARPGIRARSLGDLRGRTVAQLRGSDYSLAYARDAAILKYETNTMSQMVKMLALGRVAGTIAAIVRRYVGDGGK